MINLTSSSAKNEITVSKATVRRFTVTPAACEFSFEDFDGLFQPGLGQRTITIVRIRKSKKEFKTMTKVTKSKTYDALE